MATAPSLSQARLFSQLIETLEPEIRRGFMASVTDLQSGVDWSRLLLELERGNIDGAISALNISPEAWSEYSASVTAAYAKAGASTAAQITQQGIGTIGTRFQMSNPRAQAWIAENVGGSIVGFTREAQMTARTVIEAGYALGQGPKTIAIDLVGRVGNDGIRTGGILGLDNPRAMRLQSVTAGMRTPEGVRDLVIEKLDGTLEVRYKVNPATEQRILKAFRAGTEVPLNERVISERQYASALLKQRGDTVAVTETANAVLSARDEQWRQLVEFQGLNPMHIKKDWQHRRGFIDGRPTHIAMNGRSVMGLDTPFLLSDGSRMRYPHDPAGGARNNINCACECIYSLRRDIALV